MRTALLLLVLPLLACDPPSDDTVDHEFQTIVRQRASLEFPCGWEHVAVSPLGGWAFHAEGCGIEQVYECTLDDAKFSSDTDKVLYVCHAESTLPKQTTTPA